MIAVSIVVLLLAGLIAYSQYRPQPNRVSGFVEADEIRVGSRVGGRVQSVQIEEGQHVKRGQTLIELEPYDLLEREKEAQETLASREADYQRLSAGLRPEEVAQAKARYEQFKAAVDLLDAGSRPQEIEAARARVVVAEAVQVLAKQNYDRNVNLVQTKAITQADFDAITERLRAAQAELVVRKEELALLELGPREEEKREARARAEEAQQAWQLAAKGYRSEDIEQARAARDAARAALAAIREQKKELTIISPLDGVVEALDLRKGDMTPVGAPVLSILDDSHLWVRCYVPQNRVGLRVGQQLRITADSFPGERFLGEITYISRQAEFTPSNVQTPEERAKQVFRMKVALKEGLDKLRPGMTVDAWLDPVGDSP